MHRPNDYVAESSHDIYQRLLWGIGFFLHILQVKQNNLSSFENNLQYFASHFNFCIPSVFFLNYVKPGEDSQSVTLQTRDKTTSLENICK